MKSRMTRLSGIYWIACNANGRTYVGSSIHIACRKTQHFQKLRTRIHNCSALQNDFNEHGESSFSFRWVEVPREELLDAENKAISEQMKQGNCYNVHNVRLDRIDPRKDRPTNRIVIAVDDDSLRWITEQAKLENRSESNYLTTLIRRIRDGGLHAE